MVAPVVATSSTRATARRRSDDASETNAPRTLAAHGARERDRIAEVTAGDAEPGTRLAATGAARRDKHVADRVRDLDHRSAPAYVSSSPACVRVRAAVPAGSSRTLSAPRAASAGRHGRRCSATLTTRRERSGKSASIGKRMKNMGIEPVLVMSRAPPSARPERGVKPKPRVRKLFAMAQRVATTVPRVRFVTVTGPRGVLDRSAGLHRGERGGRKDHDEERGGDASHGRQHDQDRGACGLLLGALAGLGAERL